MSLIQDFLEDGWTVSEWMIALKAVTAHEAEHVNSSNFTDVEEIRTWYGKYLADTYNLDPTIGVNIAADAQNAQEYSLHAGSRISIRSGAVESSLCIAQNVAPEVITYNLDPTIGVNIAADAQNIVEDGRIERIAVQRRPGMVLPFRMLNEVIRDGVTAFRAIIHSDTVHPSSRKSWIRDT